MIVNQAFKFQLYPNAEQRQALARQFGSSRFVFNYLLQQRIDYYTAHKGEQKQGLNLKGMLANHHLARSISDAGWGQFLRQLQYKAAWSGCRFEAIDPFFPSSKRCHQCGYFKADLTLTEQEWDCPECYTRHDRDVNAAINILSEGRARSDMKRRAGIARTQTPGETRASRAGLRTRKLPASTVE